MDDTSKLYAVIMAGGRGERFWPAGRYSRPKQLLPLLSERSMIEETVQRLFPLIAPERLLVVTNREFVTKIRELLPIPAENVIGEPVGRDTAPCVALAAALVKRRDPEATMVLLPADHVIHPARLFQETLCAAAEQAQAGALVTLGVAPGYAATGYGYIHIGDMVAPGFYKVLEFREKPDAVTAEQFVRDGSYKWNSGIFVWRVDAICRAFQVHQPELAEKIEHWAGTGDFESDFAACPRISIDYAIMEKAENVLVGSAPFDWNDIGSWSALRSLLPVDEYGNTIRGRIAALDAEGCVLLGDDGMQIGVIGVRNLAVVQSGNGILVCPLSEEQRIKELIKQIKEESYR